MTDAVQLDEDLLGWSGVGTTPAVLESLIGETIDSIDVTDTDILIHTGASHGTQGVRTLITDDGQSCCESRYLTCDDDLDTFRLGRIVKIELVSVPDIEDDGDHHECAFFKIDTTKGPITVRTHNEHNGYYGGFCIRASRITY